MRFLAFLFSFLFLYSCNTPAPKDDPASTIVNKAIHRMGGDILDNAKISFRFRDKFYSAKRENGIFALSRCTTQSCTDTVDVLKNEGFTRKINGKQVDLSKKAQENYKNSVNSVHYFSVLPYGLDHEAVEKAIKDTVDIKGNSYYELEVGFKKQGGGKDFEDHFMYWINTESFTVDYMAYNYQVNEGGTRFRVAYNPRTVNGVRVVDYKNYKPKKQYPALQSLDSLYSANELELLSLIKLEDVTIKNCPNC